jgi:hypothetical protein
LPSTYLAFCCCCSCCCVWFICPAKKKKKKKRNWWGQEKNIPKRIIARYGLDILLARSLSRLCIHVEHVPSTKKK